MEVPPEKVNAKSAMPKLRQTQPLPTKSETSSHGILSFREELLFQPIHRPSIPGDCNVDAVRSHNSE